jgi:protein-L-isoaspartate(D-aspartate) O-methyltransferase
MHDDYRHKGLRRRLLDELRSKGITCERTLSALDQVPRHLFLELAFEELAYEDKAFPISHGQTISQPYTVAYQTQLLAPNLRQKVLEIGTGSGYQAAVLAVLGARVYTIERIEALYLHTRELLEKLGLVQIRTFFKDGYIGLGEFAPFDKILVTAAASEVPPALLDQLAIGGWLVAPIGDDNTQIMRRITRHSPTEYEEEEFDAFRFVPLLRGKQENW